MELKNYIRDVVDFPQKWVIFKDITPLLASPEAFSFVIEDMAKNLVDIDVIVGLDARGFIFASALSYALEKPLVLIRKTSKLPHETITEKYSLEYGEASFDIHKDSIKLWQKVAIVDDVLATWGTMWAAIKLVERLGGKVDSLNFLMELSFLDGKKNISSYSINSLIQY